MKGFIELHSQDNNTIIINIKSISSMWEEPMNGRYHYYIRTTEGQIFLIKENLNKISELIKLDKKSEM